MSEQNESSEGKSILQRVTQIFVGGPKAAKPTVAEVAPAEQPMASDAQKEERLAAYRKLCEEEAQRNPDGQEKAEKKIKYRAKDFNASESHAKQKAV